MQADWKLYIRQKLRKNSQSPYREKLGGRISGLLFLHWAQVYSLGVCPLPINNLAVVLWTQCVQALLAVRAK